MTTYNGVLEHIEDSRKRDSGITEELVKSGQMLKKKTSLGINKKSEMLPKSEWLTKVFEANPDIKNLKERASPLARTISFSEYYKGHSSMSQDAVLQLIMQYFECEGMKFLLRTLEKESGVYYEPKYAEDCRLVTLIVLALKEVEQIWDYSISSNGEDEVGDEILYDILSSFKVLRDRSMDLADVNIWDEPPENLVYEENSSELVAHASFNKLVEILTPSGIVDSCFLQAFMSTYTLFTTPKMLLRKLKQRYNVPNDRMEALVGQKLPIQVRVINLIKVWIDEHKEDLDDLLINDIKHFLAYEVKKDHPIQAQLLINSLDKNSTNSIKVCTTTSGSLKEPRAIVPKNIFSPTLTWEDIDDEEIARQLTLIEYGFYKKIRTKELLSQAWCKEKLKHRASHVLQVINRFNEVSQWVASTVVTTKKLKDRAKVLSKLISIADHLRKLNNYGTLMAFVAVFNSAAIHRLKHTWSEISPSAYDMLSEIRRIVDIEDGYKQYKATLETTTLPCIPYLGIYLTDLVFAEEAHEQYVNGLINFRKSRALHSIIAHIKTFQKVGYHLLPVHQIQSILLNLHPLLDDKLIFKFSCIIEPKGIDKASLP